jgi:hypothetical protein
MWEEKERKREEEGWEKGEAVQIKKKGRHLRGSGGKERRNFVRITTRRRRSEESLVAHVICHRKTSGLPNNGRTRIG